MAATPAVKKARVWVKTERLARRPAAKVPPVPKRVARAELRGNRVVAVQAARVVAALRAAPEKPTALAVAVSKRHPNSANNGRNKKRISKTNTTKRRPRRIRKN